MSCIFRNIRCDSSSKMGSWYERRFESSSSPCRPWRSHKGHYWTCPSTGLLHWWLQLLSPFLPPIGLQVRRGRRKSWALETSFLVLDFTNVDMIYSSSCCWRRTTFKTHLNPNFYIRMSSFSGLPRKLEFKLPHLY